MKDLQLTIIQSGIYWQDIETNLAVFEEKIWEAGTPDIILLPEMFNTGFTVEPRPFAEKMNGKTFKWMKNMAAQSGAVIMGSYLVSDGPHYYNRLIHMYPSGEYRWYDKRHLFRFTGEHEKMSAGRDIVIGSVNGWSVNGLVCYDLRFPVWSRNTYDGKRKAFSYDVLIYVANWPAVRISAWDILLRARAVENMCYVAGVNRVGKDGNDILYNGHSNVVDPRGNLMEKVREDEFIGSYTLSHDELNSYREKFPSHMDFDTFEILKEDPEA